MSFIVISILYLTLKAALAEISCPVPWWYCLNRDPKDMNQVKVMDTSNRSISWNWGTPTGEWNIAYVHTFTTGNYGVSACFSEYQESQPACVSYSKAETWKSNKMSIKASAWDMSYNGDYFGFQPTTSNGQYVFHIYSRNLHFNPFMTNGGAPGGGGVKEEPSQEICRETPDERTQGEGWWLERKSPIKCPIKVNKRAMTIPPKEWSWDTEAGNWKIFYSWSLDKVSCSLDYTPLKGSSSNVINWDFNMEKLILTYNAVPVRIYSEQSWKLMVIGKETWGFTPTIDGSWIFSIFSRNVIIRPFEKASDTFNLQVEK